MSPPIRKSARKKAPKPKAKSTRKTAKKTPRKPRAKKPSKETILNERLKDVELAIESLTDSMSHVGEAVSLSESRILEASARRGFGEGMVALSDLINTIRSIESNIRELHSKQPTDRLENALGRAVMLSILWYNQGDANALQIHRVIVRKVMDTLKEWASKKDVKTFEGSMDQEIARSVYDALGGHSILD